MALKPHTSNFVLCLATRSTNLQTINCPLSGRGQSHVTHSRITTPEIISEATKAIESSNFVCVQAVSNAIIRTADHPWKGLGPGHVHVAFSNGIRQTFVQHFTRFQLTVCSRSLCV